MCLSVQAIRSLFLSISVSVFKIQHLNVLWWEKERDREGERKKQRTIHLCHCLTYVLLLGLTQRSLVHPPYKWMVQRASVTHCYCPFYGLRQTCYVHQMSKYDDNECALAFHKYILDFILNNIVALWWQFNARVWAKEKKNCHFVKSISKVVILLMVSYAIFVCRYEYFFVVRWYCGFSSYFIIWLRSLRWNH